MNKLVEKANRLAQLADEAREVWERASVARRDFPLATTLPEKFREICTEETRLAVRLAIIETDFRNAFEEALAAVGKEAGLPADWVEATLKHASIRRT